MDHGWRVRVNVIIVLVFISLILVLGALVLFGVSTSNKDMSYPDQLSILPLEDETNENRKDRI